MKGKVSEEQRERLTWMMKRKEKDLEGNGRLYRNLGARTSESPC